MIIIKIIILYFIQIIHTDDFPSTGTRLVYTIMILKYVVVSKLQVAILARLYREMSETVRIDRQYILSRVRVSVRPSNFLYAKNAQKLSRKPSPAQTCVC